MQWLLSTTLIATLGRDKYVSLACSNTKSVSETKQVMWEMTWHQQNLECVLQRDMSLKTGCMHGCWAESTVCWMRWNPQRSDYFLLLLSCEGFKERLIYCSLTYTSKPYVLVIHSMINDNFFSQDSSLRLHSSENVSLNARNENGDVTGRISVGKSLKDDTCTHGERHKALMHNKVSQWCMRAIVKSVMHLSCSNFSSNIKSDKTPSFHL